MAKTKTAPKLDGADTTTTTNDGVSDAPAAVDATEQAEPQVAEAPEVTGATADGIPFTKKRLTGKGHEQALEYFNKHGKPSKNVSVGWETKGGVTNPVFTKRS